MTTSVFKHSVNLNEWFAYNSIITEKHFWKNFSHQVKKGPLIFGFCVNDNADWASVWLILNFLDLADSVVQLTVGKAHGWRRLRVKDLPKVPTWRLEVDIG